MISIPVEQSLAEVARRLGVSDGLLGAQRDTAGDRGGQRRRGVVAPPTRPRAEKTRVSERNLPESVRPPRPLCPTLRDPGDLGAVSR